MNTISGLLVHTFTSFHVSHSRVLNRTAVLVYNNKGMKRPNKYHFSKEILREPLHSLFMPKGSPLEVLFSILIVTNAE